MLTKIVDDCIHKLRPLMKAGITQLVCSPIFDTQSSYKIEYGVDGKRKVFIKDIATWKEHKFIDITLEDNLSNSGYPMIQPVSRIQLKGCVISCSAVRCGDYTYFFAQDVSFLKYPNLESSCRNTLSLLPDECLSMYPYFVDADFTGLKPTQAKHYIEGIYKDMCSLLNQTSGPLSFSKNSNKSLFKLISLYPKIPEYSFTGINFQRKSTDDK